MFLRWLGFRQRLGYGILGRAGKDKSRIAVFEGIAVSGL
jgi:hypothetical protein